MMNLIREFLHRQYDFDIDSAEGLESYEDQNILIRGALNGGKLRDKYVLKIINAEDSKDYGLFQDTCDALLTLNEKGFSVPRPIKGISGKYAHLCRIGKRPQVCMLFNFIPGTSFYEYKCTDEQVFREILDEAAEFLGKINNELLHFPSHSLKRKNNVWKLENVTQAMTGPRLQYVENKSLRTLCSKIISSFEDHVISRLDSLRNGIIHNDLNSANIILHNNNNKCKVSGIIDFGELVESKLVFDIATTIAFMMCKASALNFNLEESALATLKGYEKQIPLLQCEKSCLNLSIAARLVSYICSASLALQSAELNKKENILREFKSASVVLALLWKREIDFN